MTKKRDEVYYHVGMDGYIDLKQLGLCQYDRTKSNDLVVCIFRATYFVSM
jgi:hypothetical protein